MRLIKNIAISFFILLNLITLFVANFPPYLQKPFERIGHHFSNYFIYYFELFTYKIRLYASITGLDPRWEMFSTVKGPDWRYLIEGVCDHGRWTLPLPGQSKRPISDEYFFDFKEGKFRLNTAANSLGRKAYASYLCHKFKRHNDHSVHSIRINIQYQDIVDPQLALQSHFHFSPKIQTVLLEEAKC